MLPGSNHVSSDLLHDGEGASSHPFVSGDVSRFPWHPHPKLSWGGGGVANPAAANRSCFALQVPFLPVASCCPFTYADQYSLRLDKDALTFQAAQNDCCW